MTFRERYMQGMARFDEIFDLTDEWNQGDDPRTLREYLGLTEEEEDVWISESDEALEDLMDRERRRMIFFVDLDGTLLNDQKEITPGNRKALQRLQEGGHAAVICTGRALPSALRQAKRLDLAHPGNYIICYNGGQIYDIGAEKILYSRDIPMELTRLCFDEAHRFGISVQAYDETYVVAEEQSYDLEAYSKQQDLPWKVTEDVTSYLKRNTPKVLCLDKRNPERVTAFRAVLEPKVAGELDLFLSQSDYLEIVPHGVNKGFAVRYLCDALGIPVSRSVAAGDAENDLPMIRAAGTGAAMCNGSEPVKSGADYVTQADNNHDGVAEILERFILNR